VAVCPVADDFDIACNKTPGDEPVKIRAAYDAITKKYDEYTLRSYLEKVARWSPDAIKLYDLGNAHFVFENGFIEPFKDAFLSSNSGGAKAGMQQLQRGMDQVPKAFISSDRGDKSRINNIIFGARVTGLTDPLPEIGTVLLQYRTRWWEGVFSNAGQGTDGGMASDLPIRYTMFPVTEGNSQLVRSNRGAVMAAYLFEQDATILGAMARDRQVRIAAENLDRVFPEAEPLQHREAGTSQVFPSDELAGGSAFYYFRPGQKSQYLEAMCKPDWAYPENAENYHVFFAGEQASYAHGWIQGALGAGLRCVQQVYKEATKVVPVV
ncbi:hypothetical protein B0H63DRAFT_378973, partial [Podospora didyma]